MRAKRERRQRGREAVSSLVPDRPKFLPGLLARRRRRRIAAVAAGVVAIQVILWPFLPNWGARLVVLGLTLLAVPIVWVLSFGRV